MRSMHKRVSKLESKLPRSAKLNCSAPFDAASVFAPWLARLGVERRPEESLAETTARAMGISSQELRNRLLAGAEGGKA